jgi:signal transduction histidine kinase
MMNQALVLVVDDEEKNLKLLCALLAHEGLEVAAAPSGEAALASVEARLPDLILLDVMMPGMNGFDVCRRFKQQPRTQMIPVLMVTALKEKEDRVRALEAGADDFLSKPIDATELIVRVQSLLRIKRYYDELAAKNRQIQENSLRLKEVEQLKETLFHMVIHDLRNPLMSISGAMEIFQKDPAGLTTVQANMLEICMRGCQELKGILDSTLDIYRMEQGGMQLRKESFDWKELTAGIKPAFQVKAGARRIQLTFCAASESCALCGDPNVLSRVMSNLLDNAIRHTPDGGSIVVFSGPNTVSRSLLVGVKDSGNGIPEEYHQTVFERFAQLPQTPNSGRTGACGLGLAFCKIAVEAHSGRIWVASNGEEPGATFCFEIPL